MHWFTPACELRKLHDNMKIMWLLEWYSNIACLICYKNTCNIQLNLYTLDAPFVSSKLADAQSLLSWLYDGVRGTIFWEPVCMERLTWDVPVIWCHLVLLFFLYVLIFILFPCFFVVCFCVYFFVIFFCQSDRMI